MLAGGHNPVQMAQDAAASQMQMQQMQMAQQQMLAQQMMSQQYQMTQQQQQTQLANQWIQQQNSAQQAQQWLQDMQRSIPQSQESPTAKWQDERKNRWTQQERRQEQPTATAFEEQEVQKIDWSAKARGAFQRCFLSPSTSESPTAENLRQQLGICIEDKGDLHVIPAPISSFDELNCLPSYVLQDLQWNGITNPLPIQCQALPLVLSGVDVIGIAQTGSGKTLSYLLPAIPHIVAQPEIQRGIISPIALIVAPTRELAVQIVEEAHKVLKKSQTKERPRGVWATAVYGGGKKFQQLKDLEYGCEIVAATPGRLIDFVSQKNMTLERVTYLVLDEADRMLEEGFAGDMETISGQVRPERQVLFFSATWSHAVQKLAAGLCNPGSAPVRISVGQDKEGSLTENSHIRHARDGIIQTVQVVDIPDDYEKQVAEKRKLLEDYLSGILWNAADHKILVFVSQKQYADELADKLWKDGFKAVAMHGGKSQESRLNTLDRFRKGEFRLLVATDVIGRGIDIPQVSHVIVFDMGSIDDYVHRIGRTARGKEGHGKAMVYFEYYHKEPQIAGELCQILEASGQVVPDDLRRIAREVEEGKRPVFQYKQKWKSWDRKDRWNDNKDDNKERSWGSREYYHQAREHSRDQRTDWAKRTRHDRHDSSSDR